MYKIIKITSLIILTIFLENCAVQKNRTAQKNVELCEVLNKMDSNDQLNRKLMISKSKTYGNIFHSMLDSEHISIEKYKKFSDEKRKLYRDRTIKILKSKKVIPLSNQELKKNDSLMLEQINLDNVNTKLLIKIIKERGYPNKSNCDCELIKTQTGDFLPGIIFRHSQPEYFDKIRILIDIEKNKGNMSVKTYNFILNHLNGRKK